MKDMEWKTHDLNRPRRNVAKGYVALYYPEHPLSYKNYVLLHRLIMENHIQRYLTSKEVVHHINENKQCNEIWNLFLCSSKEHDEIHKTGKKASQKTKNKMSTSHSKAHKTRKRNSSGQFTS